MRVAAPHRFMDTAPWHVHFFRVVLYDATAKHHGFVPTAVLRCATCGSVELVRGRSRRLSDLDEVSPYELIE
jgi:hypothetical protein